MENSMHTSPSHFENSGSALSTMSNGGLDESAPQEALKTPTNNGFIKGFDLEGLRLTQDFADTFGVKRQLTTVAIRKPRKDQFFRVHPDEAWRLQSMVLDLKDEGEIYILSPAVWNVLPELAKPVTLHTAVDRMGNPFVIPVPLPGPDGKRNPWHESLSQCVLKAQTYWVRCSANMAVGGYDLLVAEALRVDPKWPEIGFEEMMAIAFRGRVIENADHPTIRQLLVSSCVSRPW
jgi:hypothetical protein